MDIFKGKKLLIIPALLIIIAIVFIAVRGSEKNQNIVLSGEVDATQIDVASKIPGRIDSVLVERGQAVQKGEILATLISPEIQAKYDQAQSAVISAKAIYEMAENGARKQDVQAVYEMYQAAKAQFEFAEKSFKRIKNLYEKSSISKQVYDETEAKYLGAKAQMLAAQQKSEMAKEGARSEEIEAARGNYERALNALKEVKSYIEETTITAPHSGEVSNMIADPGEVIASGYPLITITDLNDSWLVFYVTEDQLPLIKMGKEFEVTLPAIDKEKHLFKVSFISAVADFATKKATLETGGFDLKSFEIHLKPVQEIKDLRPGMSAWLKLK